MEPFICNEKKNLECLISYINNILVPKINELEKEGKVNCNHDNININCTGLVTCNNCKKQVVLTSRNDDPRQALNQSVCIHGVGTNNPNYSITSYGEKNKQLELNKTNPFYNSYFYAGYQDGKIEGRKEILKKIYDAMYTMNSSHGPTIYLGEDIELILKDYNYKG